MTVEIEYEDSKRTDPTEHMTSWLGKTIAKKHSLLRTIDEIVAHQLQNEVSTVGIQGREGTGKSTLAHIIAHMVHTKLAEKITSKSIPEETRIKLRKGYSVHFLHDSDLLDFEGTLRSMPDSNRIIVFDDVSFLGGKVGKKELDHLKNVFTTIRHAEHGEDYKTVIIFNYHYSKGLDIYLRDTVVKYFTSIASEETKNIIGLVGNAYAYKIRSFQRKYADFILGKPIRFKVGKKHRSKHAKTITYNYGDPFRLAMYFNNAGMSLCVYPRKEAIVPKNCTICNSKAKQAIPKEKLIAWLNTKFGEKYVLAVMRNMVIQRYGIPMKIKNMRYANECIQRLANNGLLNIDDLLSELVKSTGWLDYKTKNNTSIVRLNQEDMIDFEKKFSVGGLSSPTQKLEYFKTEEKKFNI